MKMLHLLRSKPDNETRRIIAAMSKGRQYRVIYMLEGAVDYNSLVEEIFDADQVISWW